MIQPVYVTLFGMLEEFIYCADVERFINRAMEKNPALRRLVSVLTVGPKVYFIFETSTKEA
jgi:hypothetical protein